MSAIKTIEAYFRLNGQKIKLDAYQKKFLNDTSKFRLINKSRRVGMTQTISWEATYRALTIPNTHVAILSASERLAKDVMTTVKDAFTSFSETMAELGATGSIPKTGVYSKTDVTFPQINSRIQSLPCNPKTARGPTITDLYLDEFAHPDNADEVFGAVFPTISLDRGDISSRITVNSTPLAKLGAYYRLTEMAKTPKGKFINYHIIHWSECPRLKKNIGFIKASMDDDRFRREFCNEFVDETLVALPFETIKDCVDESLTNDFDLSQTKNSVYIGIDYGKVVDSTVIIVVEITEDEVIIRHIMEFKPTKNNPASYKEASNYILRNVPRWKPSRVVVDILGPGEACIEMLKELGSMVKGETLSWVYKDRMFNHLKTLFLDRKIKIPNNEELINQLHAIQKKNLESGVTRYTHPTKGLIQHDDYVWALCLACYAAMTGSSIGGGAIGLKGSTWDLKRDDEPDYRAMY